VLWAKLNREVLEDAGLASDGTVFLRAGFTQSPKYAPLFWLGDQMTTWDRHDGIKSAVTGLLSSGLSGMTLNHGDIGGLISFKRKLVGIPIVNFYRTKELLLRWIELTAFTPLYRTHEGNNPDNSLQIDSDPEILKTFSYFAKVFKALAPYRQTLFEEAAAKGYPVVRHLWLHYPNDPVAQGVGDQWLLGADLLVAPILDGKTTSRQVYLPRGVWTHLWSGQVLDASSLDTPTSPETGIHISIQSPLGQPPVFYRQGSKVGEMLGRIPTI
jgi:alpha-glucosidase